MTLRAPRHRFTALLTAVFVMAGVMPAAFGADGDNVGDVQMCVPLRQIDDSRVIDDKTILLRIVAGSPYRRIDLAHDCIGLSAADSFTSATTISQLCQQDILRVTQQAIGSQCVIDKIVVIDEAEAKALLARRKK